MDAHAEPHCPHCFSQTSATPCPTCGWHPGLDNPPPALALGIVLDGRYRLGRVLGHGGFGITYLAWDENLQLRLAIKEYLPRDSASRAPDGVSLAVYSGPAAEQFAYGLERFLEEARALARFDQHPGIVTVKSFFRAHGTGYSVMDYVEGLTLKQYLEQQPGGRLPFDQALRLLLPVMDALRAMHREGLLHRDIAPDNIYVSRSGRIKLLDFGAARFAAGEHSKSLSVILKPGYAPEEQYRTKGKQGPWTDVYSLAATLYRAITGVLPPEALDRVELDELIPPSRLGIAIAPAQEAALLKALAVRAGDRYPSVATLQEAWKNAIASVAQPEAPHETPKPEPQRASSEELRESQSAIKEQDHRHQRPAPIKPHARSGGGLLVVVVIALVLSFVLFVLLDSPMQSSSLPTQPVSTSENVAEVPHTQLINDRYIDNGDGTVTDTTTGLQWMRCSLGQNWNGRTCLGEAKILIWDEAMRQPQDFSYAGHRDWRMPTKDELLTLVYCSSGRPQTWNMTGDSCDGEYARPTIDQTAFPNPPSSYVWSGSPYAGYSSHAWYVYFGYGYAHYYDRSYSSHVRLVCGGQ
ncbi:DUF1566 domain-containing protein [Thiocystis minor]|uniref:Lcl domain-containing protein n=1 Tax=Thiocystis minor TaxID=61597 RepID=UPI001913ABAA|nr:DUF1566 domain-containing protein [Thiocystis minor]